MWLFDKFFRKPEPITKEWIGMITARWIDENKNPDGNTYITLFVQSDGSRIYFAHGKYADYSNSWIHHRLYSVAIVPFVNGCSLDYIVQYLDVYNVDFWAKHGYQVPHQLDDNQSIKKIPPKHETDGNVIKFPPLIEEQNETE